MNSQNDVAKAPRVFLVDDDADTLAVMGYLFKSANAEVVAVNESARAVEELVTHTKRDGPFDLIALDIRMPMIDGNELARRIRAEGFEGKIVALTASASGGGRRDSKESGIDHYFGKKELTKKLIMALLQQQ